MYSYDKNKLKRMLDGLRIHELREVGEIVGVRSPSSLNFGPLRDRIIDIVTGRSGIEQRSMRGRPRKSGGNMEHYRALLESCRIPVSELDREFDELYPGAASAPPERETVPGNSGRTDRTEYCYPPAFGMPQELCQAQFGFDEEDEQDFSFEQGEFSGYLELRSDGSGFVRENFAEGERDAHLSAALIGRYNLKNGDFVRGRTEGRFRSRFPAAVLVTEVNGGAPERDRSDFDALRPLRPAERLKLSGHGEEDLLLRYIDRFAPVGRGQRCLLFAPRHTGRKTAFARIAQGLAENCPEVVRIAVLIDERPEDAAEFSRDFPGEVACSAFGERAFRHIRVAELALARAKRLAESGRDVVLFLDSATRLARAYNLAEAHTVCALPGGLEPAAAEAVKKYLSAAHRAEGGGSLTLIAAVLTETGSLLDASLADELAGAENMRLVLDAGLAERGIFPAVDIRRSGTDRAELLLPAEELEAARGTLADLPKEPGAAAKALWSLLAESIPEQ